MGRRPPQLIRRPNARGGSSPNEIAALADYLAKNLWSLFEADAFQNSGSATVAAWWDKVALVGAVAPNARSIDPAHALAQPVAVLQASLPAANANFGGALASTMAGGYESTLAALPWAFLHDGTLHAIRVVHRPSVGTGFRVLFATRASSTAQGSYAYFSSTTMRWGVQANPPGVPVVPDSAAGASPANAASVAAFEHGTSRSPQFSGKTTGSPATTGAYANPAGSGAPTNSLRLMGLAPAVASSYAGEFAALMIARDPSAAVIAAMDRYIFLKYALAA